ncbi:MULTISPECIES: hypothetical protein [Aminobacterium]|jgi:predicted transcriptional regulator|uniref:hypothetical protein n=1 Tax=Aminobacterium TaxID=81466 RepID=UPI00257EAA50|nr:hypothetical protein [Aminobacterium sp. UBA4987]
MSKEVSQATLLKELKNLIESSSLATARLIEAVSLNSQLASSTTPEMRELYTQWLNCVTGEVLNSIEEKGIICLEDISKNIGISETTALSLLLYLQRQGAIIVKEVTIKKGRGENQELCHCLR